MRDSLPDRFGGLDGPQSPADSPAAVEQTCTDHIEWRAFPVDVLPDVLRRFIIEGSKAMGCDAAMLAIPALAACAGCIGVGRAVKLNATWPELCILWAVVIARSGAMKSPPMDLALGPIRAFETQTFGEHDEAEAHWREEYERFEVALKRWKAPKGGAVSGDPRPDEPVRPECTRITVSDTTIEALGPILCANPRGVLLARDELAGWFKDFGAYKQGRGGDAERWLELHRGGTVTIDRKTGEPRTLRIERAAASVVGTIQPPTARRCFTDDRMGSGLIARLLLVMPPTPRKRWTEAELSHKTREAYRAVVHRLIAMPHNVDEQGQPAPFVHEMTGVARQLWIDFYNAHGADTDDRVDDDEAAAFAKLEAYCARFALLLHLVRMASGETDAALIEAEDMRAAVELTEWFKHETLRVYALLGGSERTDEQRRVIDWLRRRGGRCTARELQRSNARRYPNVAAAKAALDALMEADLGTWTNPPPKQGGGRPTSVFVLDDDTAPDETPAGAIENGGSVGRRTCRTDECENAAGAGSCE
jgi:hypothetical protein